MIYPIPLNTNWWQRTHSKKYRNVPIKEGKKLLNMNVHIAGCFNIFKKLAALQMI